MRLFIYYALVLLPFLSSAVKHEIAEEGEPEFAPIDKESDIQELLEKIVKLAEGNSKGGAAIASQVIKNQVQGRQELFAHLYKNLVRGPFAGHFPRCLCKFVTCVIPRCFAICQTGESKHSDIFDCTSCAGDCIPLFMRCLIGIDG